jgi:predicted nucleic acid-binding protein
MTQSSKAGAVIIDANVLIGLCAKEPDKVTTAETALQDYAVKGWLFYAPHVIVSEVLFVFCNKLQNGSLTPTTYEEAIENFLDQMKAILPPPNGEVTLLIRAKEIRSGYGCSRSTDGLYIALTEELAQKGAAEFLTFDKDVVNQIAKNAPTVKVNLLPI